mgnify:FL=1
MCDEIPESARETMRVVNETLDAYASGELSEDEAGGRVFHALFDRMMDK